MDSSRSSALLAKEVPPSYIDRLPNETLHLIFSFLPSPNHGHGCQCRQQLIHVFKVPSDLLVVRWVSRRFRIIANRCRSADILDFFQSSKPNASPEARLQTIKIFLNDAHFVNCLIRQTDWKFIGLDVFLGISLLVPCFAQNARRIDIRSFRDSGAGSIILGLAFMAHITELTIDNHKNLEESIDFDIITTACPALERLKLLHLHKHRGELGLITTLQSLNIRRHCWRSGLDYDLTLGPEYFPFSSSERLTSLCLGFFDDVSELVDMHILNHFPNLTDLEMFFLVPETCNLIINANIQLTKFTTDLTWPIFPASQLLEVLSAPSLSSVEEMSLSIKGNISTTNAQEYLDYLDPSIIAITNLRYLRRLALRMGLRKKWCQRFARLSALKSLHYDVNVYQYGEGIAEVTGCLDDEEDYTEISDWEERICVPITMAFETAFIEFTQQPRVTVS
jgi:hypothetical protein